MSIVCDFRAVCVDEDIIKDIGSLDVFADILVELLAVQRTQILSLYAFGVCLDRDKTCGIHEFYTSLEKFCLIL